MITRGAFVASNIWYKSLKIHYQCYELFKKIYGPFLWMGFNCLKTKERLWRESLLFTTKPLEIPGTELINLRGMKGWVNLGATQWFLTQNPWIGNPASLPLGHCFTIKLIVFFCQTTTRINFKGTLMQIWKSPYLL